MKRSPPQLTRISILPNLSTCGLDKLPCCFKITGNHQKEATASPPASLIAFAVVSASPFASSDFFLSALFLHS
jgi:hypothetical protein